MFNRYSGYIVDAPPRAAGSGTWLRVENSVRNGLVPGRKCGTTPFSRTISSTDSHGYGAIDWCGTETKSVVRMNGSVKYTGSVTMLTRVRRSPWRIQCSVNVARSLRGMPLRRIQPILRWVVVTVRTSPSHFPVEKPCQV